MTTIVCGATELDGAEGNPFFAGLHKGNYFWIVGYGPDSDNIKWLRWISDSYSIDISPIADFKVATDKVLKLPLLENMWKTLKMDKPTFTDEFLGYEYEI